MQIYQLKSLIISTGRRNCNGGYTVAEQDLGLFDSRETAEISMHNVIRENTWDRFFAFFIYERSLNPALHEEGFLSVTSYLADGTFYCESPYDEACRKKFCGRDPDTIRLKSGDLAWYRKCDTIEPCLVFSVPWTKEEYASVCRKNGRDPVGADAIKLDYTDDSYMVFCYDRNHQHPAAWELFPFHEKITKRNMARLLETKKLWEVGCPI